MRRVLVPLDGTAFAASILPDACRLAGGDGTLVLISGVSSIAQDASHENPTAGTYALDRIAERLRDAGHTVETHAEVQADQAVAIATAAEAYRTDLIACASHGRRPLGRLVSRSFAWRALALSPVPVMVRHPAVRDAHPHRAWPRRIMVPLDGSRYAERALTLARMLAAEWDASLVLAHVVPGSPIFDEAYVAHVFDPAGEEHRATGPEGYLGRIAATLPGPVESVVAQGGVVAQLRRLATKTGITDIVVSSHGRIGVARAVYGSVTDSLIHHLYLPIVVVPSHATVTVGDGQTEEQRRFRLTVPPRSIGTSA